MTNQVFKPVATIQQQTDEKLVYLLVIPEDLYYFRGHFDQAAVLPGVAQIDWVMHYLSEDFLVDTKTLVSIDQLKFQHIIRPKYEVNLSIEKIAENKYLFNYSSTHGQHSSGKVVLTK